MLKHVALATILAAALAGAPALASDAKDAKPETAAEAKPEAAAAGDVKAGEKVFKKCRACHVVKSEKNKVGPHLVNVFNRKPASAKKFKYSKAMKKFAETNEWTVENMTTYLAKPRKFIKGTKMAFPGLKKEADIVNVIAYLKQFSD